MHQEPDLMENGNKIKLRDLAVFIIQIMMFMKENGKKVKKTEEENTNMLMDKDLMEHGLLNLFIENNFVFI